MAALLKNRKILLGVTGSIAAYKAPLIVRELIKEGSEVKVILTPSAREFVSSLVLSNLSRNKVIIDMFNESYQTEGAWHIHLAHWCDVMLVAPCSATSIGRYANGIFDTALSAVMAALPKGTPMIVAPAMDTEMWLHPSTQRNIDFLKNIGTIIVPPAEGELSSGLSGPGRLPDISFLLDAVRESIESNPTGHTEKIDNSIPVIIESLSDKSKEKSYDEKLAEILSKPIETLQDAVDKDKWNAEIELEALKLKQLGITKDFLNLTGKKILITAGPTYERLDDVRFIGNFSSGKMGFAIAKAAAEAGADVSLISGPVNLDTPHGKIVRINVESAAEMYEQAVNLFPQMDIAVLAAAVADFTPEQRHPGKIKKTDMGDSLSLQLAATKDILAALGDMKKPNQILVGFALESDNEIENAKKKLISKKCDYIVLNSASKPHSGFGGDDNTITVISKDGAIKTYPPLSKLSCAKIILNFLAIS